MGAAIIAPAFTQHQPEPPQILVMLSFNIQTVDDNTSNWCNDLSSLLKAWGIRSVVFVTGEVAEADPECLRSFPSNVDIGSQGYSYTDLVELNDYTLALEQVKKGKQIVDGAGNLNSLIFKAPFGSTDDDIYSLLSRSGILADFSYVDHYNKYEGDQFVRYDLVSIYGNKDELARLPLLINDNVRTGKVPLVVNFDSVSSMGEIIDAITLLRTQEDVEFINASDLMGGELTIRLGDGAK